MEDFAGRLGPVDLDQALGSVEEELEQEVFELFVFGVVGDGCVVQETDALEIPKMK